MPWQLTRTLVFWPLVTPTIRRRTSRRSASLGRAPAYTGEQVPEELLPLLVAPEWVEERKLRWGVTSPIYQSKVLGEFPDLSDDTLILPK